MQLLIFPQLNTSKMKRLRADHSGQISGHFMGSCFLESFPTGLQLRQSQSFLPSFPEIVETVPFEQLPISFQHSFSSLIQAGDCGVGRYALLSYSPPYLLWQGVCTYVHLISYSIHQSFKISHLVIVLGKLDLSKPALLQGCLDLDGQATVLSYLIFDQKSTHKAFSLIPVRWLSSQYIGLFDQLAHSY